MTSVARTCEVDGCEGKHHARGKCRNHYETLRPGKVNPTKWCTVPGCENPFSSKGRCKYHNRRFWTYGVSATILDELLSQPCGICGDEDAPKCIDHDHGCCKGPTSCGKCIRGVLCLSCNKGLGMFKDSTESLANAIKYLRSGVLILNRDD